jgi:hypothetical protein
VDRFNLFVCFVHALCLPVLPLRNLKLERSRRRRRRLGRGEVAVTFFAVAATAVHDSLLHRPRW